MSKRVAGLLQEDIEYLNQISADDIHEAQEKIIEILRDMEANGDIIAVPNGTYTDGESENKIEVDDDELDLS
ncbi:hypothetical protein AGMMS50293_20810 [Spirochaetia bacterium]|nr:hypothetical protein AGMMS50293_20810 [Spirochaetia bacterium]